MQVYFSQHIDGGPADESGELIFITVPSHKKLTKLAGPDLGFNPDIQATFFTLRNVSSEKEVVYRVRIE